MWTPKVILLGSGARSRDGNGYPRPVTRWVFLPLGGGFGSDFIPTGLLVGQILYPAGLGLVLLNPDPVPTIPVPKLK
jgi:hypothetical protein